MMIRRRLLQLMTALAASFSLKANERGSKLSYDAVFDGVRQELHMLRAVLSDNGYGPEEVNLIKAVYTPISVKADKSDKSIRYVSIPLRLTYKVRRNEGRN